MTCALRKLAVYNTRWIKGEKMPKPERVMVDREQMKTIMMMLASPYSSSSDAWDYCLELVNEGITKETREQLANEMIQDVKKDPDNYDEPEDVVAVIESNYLK